MTKTRSRKGLNRFLRGVLGVMVLFGLLSAFGAVYQARSSAADRVKFQPPGELTIVDGRTMHIHCQGEGTPTVILDAGQGGWSIAWAEIAPKLVKTTRVCAYDRAGYGWSEAAQDRRSPQNIAADLAELLQTADTAPPYVITGFSYTGLSSRLFAAKNPNDVVGMVLVDPATEFDNQIMDASALRQQRATVSMFRAFELASRIGLVRLLNPRDMAPYAPFLPEEVSQPDIYYSFVSEPSWWQTSRKEFAARLSDEVLSLVAHEGHFRDIPTIIIGAETVNGTTEGLEDIHEAHLSHLRELASRSSRGEFVLAENSSHDVQRDRPDLVIEAIERVIERASN